MADPAIHLTTYEKVQLLWLFPIILTKTIFSTLSTVVVDRSARHLRRTLGTFLLRHAIRTLSLRQQLAPDVPTAATIAAFCAANTLLHSPRPVPIPPAPASASASAFHNPVPDATLHLVTAPGAASGSKRTLLYLHGGGYIRPLNGTGQLPLALRAAQAARAGTLAVLEYGLAPGLRYPGQLVQSAAALKVLLGEMGVPPEEVVLLGDSAGANAVLGLLAWACAGRGPDGWDWGVGGGLGDEGGGGRRRLGAAVLVSPWCGVGWGRPSYAANERWDYLSREAMERFQEAVRITEGEVWGDMLGAAEVDGEKWGEGFWRRIVGGESRLVERTLVTVGTREVFLGDVTEMAQLMGAGEQDEVQFVKCDKEVHVGAVVDVAMRIDDGEMLTAVLSFLKGL
ncbi:Alpha/Beta hydrolase protein [Macrophomina phaseolina]|uniref:Alpha/Beta hydrolase protein n=1 Tax=Macrophomina phaseolina TaxID=35725 RepID=A0ABQ8GGV4_9PEZI|nr:Alpha/Beta hydrolase protein [Macrophomina phaseolina]